MDPARDRCGAHLKASPCPEGVSEVEGRYFDCLVRERGEFDPFAPRGWRTIARRFAEMVPADSLSSLLDIGCGTGQSRQVYADRTAGYVGIDIPYRQVVPRLINACLSLFNAADWVFQRIGLGRWFGTFILTVGRKPIGTRRP